MLKRIVCTTCGSSLEASADESVKKCDSCGNTFLVTDGEEFSGKSEKEISSIKKLRANLKNSIKADDHKNILHFSKEILRLIPKDYAANYFYAYSNYSFGSRRYLFDFYNRVFTDLPLEVERITKHMIDYADIRDKNAVEIFISNNMPQRLDEYRKVYQQKLIDEENYSQIPRDVFISFRSSDLEWAEEVLKELEKDGNTCWISTRNLRPNDNENYWNNIEDAITKCKLFLVVSSHDAMISRDVKKEIDIATKLLKPRIEYKIDSSAHTSFFKYFFDGEKWIDATNDKEEAIKTLVKRVYEAINTEVKKATKRKTKKQLSEIDEFTKKINRSRIELLSGSYKDAAHTVKDALGISPDSSEAWWLLFLSENELASTEAFDATIMKNISFAQLVGYYNQVPYQQYKKYEYYKETEFPSNIQNYERILYDEIMKYTSKSTITPKAKRSTLGANCKDHILHFWYDLIQGNGFDQSDEIIDHFDDDTKVKEFKPVFDDFDDIKSHEDFHRTPMKKMYEEFIKKYSDSIVKRDSNLNEINETIIGYYQQASNFLINNEYKEAMKAVKEIFYYDNTYTDKYLYFLLAKLKVNNTYDAYDALNKMRKKDKINLINSTIFQKLFDSENYREFIEDLYLHVTYKKRNKKNRINLQLWGE